jgi:3-dehydroquinate dehydratase-2
MSHPIYVLNGPNLNLLGTREPEIYGHDSLADIETDCKARAAASGFDLVFRQTNHEGVLIDWVQEANASACALLINAAGLTHTSVALHDALKTVRVPIIEVHLSNPHKREAFRHHSFISPIASGVIVGFGRTSYSLAIEAAVSLLKQSN